MKQRKIGSSVAAVPCDVTVAGDLDRLFEQIKKHRGTLDTVFATQASPNTPRWEASMKSFSTASLTRM
jgi:NAD(P)-dependent dehydrogenase (short-subunit alcohol dehydrogenase family)